MLVWACTIIILAFGAFAAAVYVISPGELVRTQLVQQVKSNTGRTLTIGGAPSLTFYPGLGVSLPSISLSPPPGMDGGPTIRADNVRVYVALMPLLSRRVVVNQLTLDQPVIDLRVDRNGRASWQFAHRRGTVRLAHLPTAVGEIANDAVQPEMLTEKAAVLAAASNADLALLDNLELRSLRINNGIVQYFDQRTGDREIVSDVDLELDGRRISDPMSVSGALNWNRQRLNVVARLESLRQLLHSKPARAAIKIASKPANLAFDGSVTLAASPRVDGKTKLSAASLASFLEWIGFQLPNGRPLGGASIDGRLIATRENISLNGATIGLGDLRLGGSFSARLTGQRPHIKANFNVAKLDVDKLSAHLTGGRPIERQTPAALPGAASPTASPKSIEEILRKSAPEKGGAGRFSPQVRGFTKKRGWGRDEIDGTALQLADADVRLRIDGMRFAGLSIDRTTMRLTVNAGSARADIDDIALYGGRGRGVITARGDRSGLRVGANVAVNEISAQPFLNDAADLNLVAGKGRLTAAVGGNGKSEQAIMSSLAGRASFVFNDGAIVGWNIPQLMRGLQRGRIGGLDKSPQQKTDFSELSANFTISRGVANTQDLKMLSPLMRLSGSGNTDLGRRLLDMILRPRLVASLSGQGGQNDLSGIEVPVRVLGNWDDPKIKPDLNGILGNSRNVNETVKSITNQLKGKKAGEIVRDLLGGQDNENDGNNNAGKLLKKLFKN